MLVVFWLSVFSAADMRGDVINKKTDFLGVVDELLHSRSLDESDRQQISLWYVFFYL